MAVTNPRFPHRCRIIRKTADNPLEEQGGFTPFDGYDPLGSDDAEDTYGSSSSSTEETSGVVEQVIYEGECRSYEKNTTSDRGEIISSYRGLALPLTQDDWTLLGFAPQEGDEVAVDHGAYVEYGRVVDKNPATASFAGTHLIWRFGRN